MVIKGPECICHEHKAVCDCEDDLKITPVMAKAIVVGAVFIMIFVFVMAAAINSFN